MLTREALKHAARELLCMKFAFATACGEAGQAFRYIGVPPNKRMQPTASRAAVQRFVAVGVHS
jgi:hypothetical protein